MALSPTTGLNSYYLIDLLENLSNLTIGPDPNADDINQDLVLQFLKEGYQTIIAANTRWPWFETNWYLNTVANQQNYVTGYIMLSTTSPSYVVPVAPQSLYELGEIVSFTNTTNAGNELILLPQSYAESIWVGTSNQAGIPAYFSKWGSGMKLWPKPNGVYLLSIRGYRLPSLTWLNDSNNAASVDYVDINQELHMPLVNYAMARIFQFQEDREMADTYMRFFQLGIKNYMDSLVAPSSNQPLILSGGLQNQFGGPWSWILPGAANGVPLGRLWY
jgi:hypothetical protein